MTSGAALTILLPEDAHDSWAAIIRAIVGSAAEAMTEGLGLPPPSLVVTRQGSEVVLLAGPSRHVLHAAPTPEAIAEAALHALSLDHWEVLLAPALAARGIGARWWLRHAARRGLTIDELADLARNDASEDEIAWRLADTYRPTITLMAGRDARAALSDADVRRGAAMQAAALTGLPIPFPGEPVADPLIEDQAAVVMIGALRGPALSPTGIGTVLAALAPALVDPALAVALMTDEARIPRRLGTLALAAPGPVAVARAMLGAFESALWPIDLVAVVEAEAGLAARQ
ncbi:hypothetical protein [Elioraea sp.]|uniref:hypothetical protein n=1 Tax=Elioraea sp. TaxID=2185103 RepID=UPI0025BE4047|nr:hypothetical protein [Elioraea sp.]